MFFSDEDYLSESDKVDRIYKMLRAQQRNRRIALFIRVLFFSGIIYGVYYLSLPAHAELRTKANDMVQEKMMEFITPMVGSMVQSLTTSMQNPDGTATNKTSPTSPTITPEMVKAVQDAMKKK